MKNSKKKIRIGIVGCGAIGSRIAKSVQKELKGFCTLSALFDINFQKSKQLVNQLKAKSIIKKSLKDLLKSSDFIIEAVNAKDTQPIIREALKMKKNVLAMSVGKLLNAHDLFSLATKNHSALLLPSGAIAGVDAIKAASLVKISSVTLTTRKHPSGFVDNAYITQKGINLREIDQETVIFDGDVDTAVKFFPQNINVAATLSLASQVKEKVRIRIITSPHYKTNSHEVEVLGDFGRITTLTDNVVCPDNPKTSYLAVLSGIQTLKQFFSGVKIGT